MESTDKELLLACRSGDEAAWEALVNRYQRLIYAIPRRAGLDDDQSADVFRRFSLRSFQKLDGIDQPERLHAWLVTDRAAQNLALHIEAERECIG